MAEANERNDAIPQTLEGLQNVDHGATSIGDVLKATGAGTLTAVAEWQASPPQNYVAITVSGNVSVAASSFKVKIPIAGTVRGVTLTCGTAPATTAIILDVRKNAGTNSLFGSGNQPTIAAAATSSAEFAPDVAAGAIAAGDILDLNITQIGTVTVGANLTALIRLS